MEETMSWHDLRELEIEGKGWTDTASFYDRLPARAQGRVREPVWDLSRHSAGLCARFVTEAPAIQARWTLTAQSLAMPHMPATGVSGLDLYARTGQGQWRWLAVGVPQTFPTSQVQLVGGLPPGRREYLLYLPLYNGVSAVEIGLPAESHLEKAPARPTGRQRPLVFYGTSITQGGCASRPGMVHTALLGRWLDCPVINLGFSGNGKMEPEVGELMAELDAAAFVVDCLPNMAPQEVAERTIPLVQLLRRARPAAPIVLVEDRSYSNAFFLASARQRNLDSRAALRAAHDELIVQGVGDLHYLTGEELLGEDGEGTVDASHPTDLGFMRQAQAFLPLLQRLSCAP
ncbi:MAG: hypothetical protein EXS58_03470 [Candidatus Latescibacteria bacterium]|nr:hypothetical protein [Candidatus Latescibacterota bacterium]